LVPLQLPPPEHDVGLLPTFHDSVELPPAVILAGLRLIDMVGVASTFKVADPVAEPALLLQVSVYVWEPAADITPVLVLPLADLLPDHAPLAVHDVGLFATVQLIVELLPVPIVVGLTAIVILGLVAAGVLLVTVIETLAESLPPALEQSRLYVNVFAVPRLPVLWVPLAALVPVQDPLAVQVEDY
jgi:hypothetical protein